MPVLELMHNLDILKIKNIISSFSDRVPYMPHNVFLETPRATNGGSTKIPQKKLTGKSDKIPLRK